MRFSAKVVVCLFFALLAVSGTAAARTIYVNAAYYGTHQDGTEVAPYRTIASALLAAAPGTSWETGDVILLMPGRYYGYFRPKNFVTIQGTDPARVFITDPMVTAYPDAANVRFLKVTFYDDCHTAFIVNRVGLSKGTWIFDDCVFEEIRRGVDARGNVDVRMTRCVFFGPYDYDYSFMMEYGTGVATFTNCVFFQPRQNALILTRTETGRIEVVNSIFVAPVYGYVSPTAVYAGTYSYPTPIDLGRLVLVRYSDLYRFSLQASIHREALIWSDPSFRYAGGYYQKPDLRLRSTSPCIDRGTFVGLPFLGSAPDMGAYEYDGTPDPPPPPPPPPPPAPTVTNTLDALESSYSDLTEADLETPAEQRRNAFLNKLDAITRQYDDIKSGALNPQNLRKEYQSMRDKLTGDLLAKCDAHVGGNESNDWIVDPDERAEIYTLIVQAVSLLDKEIAALP